MTLNASSSEYPLTPTSLLAAGAAFLLDKSTTILLGLLVSIGTFLIAVAINLSALNYQMTTLQTQVQANVDRKEYEADQRTIATQLENIRGLLEQENSRSARIESRVERIDDYLLNK
ncbi:MAG: hypothetical protein M3Q81_04470 [bacterium]|nr:hypothetical protein [bacterium]